MTFWEMSKAAAMCGAGGGNGSNLFSGEIEQGSISYPEGEPFDSTTRLRTKGYTKIEAKTYSVFWTSSKILTAYAFLYDESGTFVERYNSSDSGVPFSFTLSSAGKIKLLFLGNETLEPSDIKNITLVEN